MINRRRTAAALGLMGVLAWSAAPVAAQGVGEAGDDWPRHNLDEYNSRFSPLGEIDRSNVGSLELKWSCLLYTSPSPRDGLLSRMPSSA